jgi:hypothetical protein
MKICPQCRKTYEDDNLNFCLDDGTALSPAGQAAPTVMMPPPRDTAHTPPGAPTQWQQPAPPIAQQGRKSSKTWLWVLLIVALLLLLCGGGIGGLILLGLNSNIAAPDKNTVTPGRTTVTANKPGASPSVSSSPTPTAGTTAKEYLTLENYNRLKNGMERSEVESILGGKGEEISDTSGGGMRFTVVQWEDEDFTSIIVTFKNNKIMTKTQVGLK